VSSSGEHREPDWADAVATRTLAERVALRQACHVSPR